MPGDSVTFDWMQSTKKREEEEKIFGITVCTVVDNIDCNRQMRVQLSLPWLPGFQPWARVSNQSAGNGSGSHFIPQVGDEVLVMFNHGDVREPFVVGALHNAIDTPPSQNPADALSKRKIRTPVGHELEFDDLLQKVTLTTNLSTTIMLDSQKAQISTPAATITLGVAGDVSITGRTKITLDAPIVEINGKAAVTIGGKAVQLKASAACQVQGKPVMIN
jgi:uncharacterized protein involved in type VI secretion and phage assembly